MPALTLNQLLPDYWIDESGDYLGFKASNLPGLTPAECGQGLEAPGGADSAEFCRAFIENMFTRLQEIPQANRPSNLAVSRGSRVLVAGTTDDWNMSYTVTIRLRPANINAATELT